MQMYCCALLIVLFSTIQEITSDMQCITTADCFCSTVQATYEYQCSFDDPKIVIQVSPDQVDIQCITEIDWNTQKLPPIKIGDVKSLAFRMCPLPNSFISIMERLGINSTKTLKFDYSTGFENITLTSDYFIGLENLERLVLSENSIEQIDKDAFKMLENLVEIDLRNNNLLLTDDIFKHSKKLRLLDLAQNKLTHLPSGLFQNLTELGVLYLWSNKLKKINGDLFKDLKKLKSLELSSNDIEEIPEHLFNGLESLKTVSLMKNKFQTLPAKLFQNNLLLEGIKINMNPHLTELPSGLFSNLQKLGSVLVSDCRLINLPSDLFQGSPSLQNISLQRNNLEHLPEDLFDGLSELQNLDLSNNKIRELPEKIFSGSTKLQSLNLENNLISNIGNMLYNLQNLHSINLKRNKIARIRIESFQRAVNLKEILLANNYLELSTSDLKLGLSPFNSNLKLEKLDLSHNHLNAISDDWIYAQVSLKELDLSYNNITELDVSKLITPSQKVNIDLRYNQISTVNFYDAEIFARNQENLDARSSNSGNTVVNLNNNPIICDCLIYDFARYIERSIDPLVPTLVTVIADELTCVAPNDFINYPVMQLKSDMLTCPLKQLLNDSECPENCNCAYRPSDKSLIYDCAYKNLKQAPQLILPTENFYNQTEVHLDGNTLMTGPIANMGYENVTKLKLSYNNINEILWIPPKVKVLELDNNNLSSIQHEVLSKLNTSSYLTNITLGSNPWNCECSIMNLSTFLVSHLTNKQIDARDIKCNQNGKLLVHLSTTEICPAFTNVIIALSVSLALVAFVIAVITVLYYNFEQEIKIWLFAHNMCLWFVTEEELDKDKVFDAFISYSHQDEDFLKNELLPILELGPHPYKICIHIRDWIIGEFIPVQIVRSVEESRRTIVILSRHFLKSCWGKIEFRTAHTQAISEGRARVILIVHDDIDLENDLDDELKAYIKTNTYIKWGDPWFWDKLRYALPHSKVRIKKRSQKSQNVMISLNDKLDLINGIPTTPNPGSTPPAISLDPLLRKTNPLNFTPNQTLTPPAESGFDSLLVTVNK